MPTYEVEFTARFKATVVMDAEDKDDVHDRLSNYLTAALTDADLDLTGDELLVDEYSVTFANVRARRQKETAQPKP
jgi:hypothetical protein